MHVSRESAETSVNLRPRSVGNDCHCAAVLIERTREFCPSVRPSVCPSVPNGLLTRKTKNAHRRTKLGLSVLQGRSACIVGPKDQRSGGRPHNMSALGRHRLRPKNGCFRKHGEKMRSVGRIFFSLTMVLNYAN